MAMKKFKKNKKFHVSQLRNRILTYWITKGWLQLFHIRVLASQKDEPQLQYNRRVCRWTWSM